jgi:hypothetical protein
MWVPRVDTICGDDELYCRARGSDRVVVEAEGAVIRLVTRCTSAAEFIERFARFTTETDIVVPALPHVSAGTDGHFVICLKDRSVMMQGRCEVTEIQPVTAAPGAATPSSLTALMHLRLREMDAHSCGIHLRLMERRALSPRPLAGREAVPTAVPVLDISAVTVVRDGRPPSDTEPTAISPPPRPETRVPGAAFTLPANPLSDLDASDLASFVELTLLETKGAVEAASIESGAIVDSGRQADPDPEGVRPPGPGSRSDTGPDRARRIIRSAAIYGSCVLGGLLLGNAFRPGAKAPPVAVTPDLVADPVVAPPSTAPAPVAQIAAPAPRDCLARVTTRPAGAVVSWGDIALGSSPIERAAIPCGTAIVTLRREHYAEVTRTITTERGRNAVVAERLVRPAASVVVTSSPAHAVIKVNKRRVGSAPRTINALQFERVRIEASLPGYQPWRKTLYLKEAESQVDVRLVRLAEANARPATPPSASPPRATPPPSGGAATAVAAR